MNTRGSRISMVFLARLIRRKAAGQMAKQEHKAAQEQYQQDDEWQEDTTNTASY